MIELIVDFETYIDRDYTLRKLTYHEYVTDRRFKVHGMGVKINEETSKWITSNSIVPFLDSIPWHNTRLIAHNMPFDGLILSHIYGKIPAMYVDTLGIARSLDFHRRNDLDSLGKRMGLAGKLKSNVLDRARGVYDLDTELEADMAKYCLIDVDLTYEVYRTQMKRVDITEYRLNHIFCDMFCNPKLRLNIPLVRNAEQEEVNEQKAIITRSGYTREQLASQPQFVRILKKLDVAIPMKENKNGVMIPALAKNDAGFAALRENEDIQPLLEARLAAKSTSGPTRARRLVNIVVPPAWRDGGFRNLPIPIKYFGTHTGRGSGYDKLNPQNFKRGGALRRAIEAPPGYVILVLDSGQIEARVLAWLTDHTQLLNIFKASDANEGFDPYVIMASRIYSKPPERIIKMERFIGKVATLALGYGMGWKKFKDTLETGALGPAIKVSDQEAKRIVYDIYRPSNEPVTTFWNICQDLITLMQRPGFKFEYKGLTFEYERIRSITGPTLTYPNLTTNKEGDTIYGDREPYYIYGGKLTENLVQKLARDIIFREQIVKVVDETNYPLVLQTHDENAFLVPENEVEEAFNIIHTIMTTSPWWAPDLPLTAEGGWARNYSK